MSANLEAAIQEQMQVLSDDEQREVLDFIEEIKRRPRKTIWEKLDERLSKLPPEVIAPSIEVFLFTILALPS